MGGRLPSAWTAAWQLLAFLLIEDTAFYWVHRLLHHRLLYRHIHKVHHTFRTPIGVAAEYTHPLEWLVANSGLFLAGPVLCGLACGGVHLATMWLWLLVRLTEAVEGHSGYAFPWSPYGIWPGRPSAAEHDWHHSKNVGNFGSFFVWWARYSSVTPFLCSERGRLD